MFLSQDTHVDYEYLGVCVPVHIVHDIHVVGTEAPEIPVAIRGKHLLNF